LLEVHISRFLGILGALTSWSLKGVSRPVIRTEANLQLYVLEMLILLQVTDTGTANETSVNTPTTAANTGVTPSMSEAEALLPTDITPYTTDCNWNLI